MSSNSKLTTYTPNGIRVVIGDGANPKYAKAVSKSLKRLNEEAEAVRRLELEADQKSLDTLATNTRADLSLAADFVILRRLKKVLHDTQDPYAGHEEVE